MIEIDSILAIVIIGATVLNLYIVYLSYLIKKPVIDIKLENLPPYDDKTEKTILKLKNIGQKDSSRDFTTILSGSWMPSMSLKFNLPERHFLAQNEEIIWKFRLDENIPPNSSINVIVKQKFGFYRTAVWTFSEQIN